MKCLRYLIVGLLPLTLVACAVPGRRQPQEAPKPLSSAAFPSEKQMEDPEEKPVEVVATHLTIPWVIAFLPGGDMLVTERPGTLLLIGADETKIAIDGVRHVGEGGLLGLTLHPNFEDNGWLYLYRTIETENGFRNRIDRYTLVGSVLTDQKEILSGIPGAVYHDGGALAFGPDGFLYVTTGDAGNSSTAQDTASLAGKILRLHDDGSIPEGNPFGSAVYSYGHRNPQGLAWDRDGNLWSTEHGRSGALSGFDELNWIEKGGNYGWPEIEGDETREGMMSPVLHSGASDTWAPASLVFHKGSLYFGGLRGESLYEVELSPLGSTILKEHFHGEFGRIRNVTVGPDGYLYLTTSNRDGRGSPVSTDDRIIRVDPTSLH